MRKKSTEKIKRNIALIGMAGVGKSFIGKYLADRLGFDYVEMDQLITKEARKIGVKKDTLSDKEFIKLEEKAILKLDNKSNSVFDTGGSVIYSKEAMKSLKKNSIIVYLKDTVGNIKKRFEARGEPHLIGIKGKSFEKLFKERNTLYGKYANFIIDVSRRKEPKDILGEIFKKF